jgi:hypothetical protein
MLNRTKALALAAIVATSASVALAGPTYARQVAHPSHRAVVDEGWALYQQPDNKFLQSLDVRSPESKWLDPTGGTFQGP